MKEIINHPTYGEIIYTESIWTGKKTLTVNGTQATPISKKSFSIDGKEAVLKGSALMGVKLLIGDDCIKLSSAPKWYEWLLALLPIIFLLTWGSSVSLVLIFPVVGGAIGGALGGVAFVFSLFFMKSAKAPLPKLLIGIAVFAITILIAFLLAVLILNAGV